MRPIIISLLAFVAFASSAFGQIELSTTEARSIIGASNPRVAGDAIIVGSESEPKVVPVLIVRVVSTERVRLVARRSLYELADIKAISPTEYLLYGDGEYLIEAMSVSWDRSLKVRIGKPKPPEPPEPPKPPPEPPKPPTPPVPNDYNIGAISLQHAPSDSSNAMKFATAYRAGAAKLYGQGGLSDIGTILTDINKTVANRVCRDKFTCEQWDDWKTNTAAALTAEQSRRKTFTRQDWYNALSEIATSLEAVQ